MCFMFTIDELVKEKYMEAYIAMNSDSEIDLIAEEGMEII